MYTFNNKTNTLLTSQKALNRIDQVVSLYDQAIYCIKQTQNAILDKDFEKRYLSIKKTVFIIDALQLKSNLNINPEITNALHDHYGSIYSLLSSIQEQHGLETCDRIVDNLEVIRQSWEHLAEKTQTFQDPSLNSSNTP